MKQSPLHALHQSLGAYFETAGTWEMPLHYGDPIAEHHAIRNGVGIADLSHRGKIQVTGDDQVTWLQSIASNNILLLKPGQGLYSSFMSHKGKILSYFRVYRLDTFLFIEDAGEVGDATYQAFQKFLLYGTKAKMKNCNESWGILLVCGKKAPTILQQAFGVDIKNLVTLSFLTHELNGEQVFIAKTEETGELDFEILGPTQAIIIAWEKLAKIGKHLELRPIGTQARETLRIEAGIPKFGPDLNENIVPSEANLEKKAVSLNKGCYPGQEVVARMDTYGSVKRRLVGLFVNMSDSATLSVGSKVLSGSREVGWISSTIHSPTLNKRIAFAFLLRDFTTQQTKLTVKMEEECYIATVQTLPFYSSN